jgi:tRNA (cmo5U34)-methyltransferase
VCSALPGSELEIELMLKLIRAWCPEPRTALDLGCGDGFLGRTLLEHFSDCHVWFLDFSDPMLDAPRDKLRKSDRATIIKADFTSSEWISRLGKYPTFDLSCMACAGQSRGYADTARVENMSTQIAHCRE